MAYKKIEITKEMFRNYLIDVLGYDEEEAQQIIVLDGNSYLSDKQKKECIEWNQT